MSYNPRWLPYLHIKAVLSLINQEALWLLLAQLEGILDQFTEADTACWLLIKAAGGNLGESQTRGPGARLRT